MFIKLSFYEEVVTVPNVWAGFVVSLRSKPQVMGHLPKNVSANKALNHQAIDAKSHAVNYDYYFQCDHHDEKLALRSIVLLLNCYKRKYEERNPLLDNINLTFFYANEEYPKQNEIIISLAKMQKQAHEECINRAASLRNNIFHSASLSLYDGEEEPACCPLM